ncbi:MAG: ABC-type transporter, integral rane subunit [Subtercola sp.]|nr:ABC-type transporter, integral rane subunit [Subtercola sp.]
MVSRAVSNETRSRAEREPSVPAGKALSPKPEALRRESLTQHALRRYGVVLVWIALIIGFGIARPTTFLTPSNFAAMFGTQAALLILTLSLVITLSVGEMDLSVASVLGLSAVVTAVLNTQQGWPWPLAVAAGLACGPIVGAANAFFVVVFEINALIITLGMGTLVLGISTFISDSSAIGGVDPQLTSIMLFRVFTLPVSFWLAIIVMLVIWYVQQFTTLGRHMLFTGQNHTVARLAGIRVNLIRFGAYALGGLVAAIAGEVVLAIAGGIEASSTQNLLLPAFAAAFLGAAVIQPGRFNAWGAAVAVFFLITGITGLQLLGLDAWIQNAFYGAALVVAVTASKLMARSQRER